jgi:hypothetical protein
LTGIRVKLKYIEEGLPWAISSESFRTWQKDFSSPVFSDALPRDHFFCGGHVPYRIHGGRIQAVAELSLHRQCKSFILDTGFFVSFSFLFAFMGYLSNLQLKDDILSPVRQKLVEYWEVKARRVCRSIPRYHQCHDCIPGRAEEADLFSGSRADVKNPVGTGSNQIASARSPFLGVLNINSRNDNIDEMTGLWYDIDNSILNLARMPALKGWTIWFTTLKAVRSHSRARLPGFARWRGCSGNPHNGDGSALPLPRFVGEGWGCFRKTHWSRG